MIDRLCAGDSDAWSEFIERYRRLIYSAIHRANGRYRAEWDETALDELFEDALYKLLRHNGRALRSWKGQCKLETWVYRIVRNVCIDRMRKEGRRGEVAELEESSRGAAGAGDETASRRENRDLRISLEQAIDRALTTREALAVKLIYFEGFTYREVAAGLGLTVGAMSGLVYRALAKLRAEGGVARYWEER
ncbi:MAG: RNA polymerase sigma factor [Candidatus Eisenbacteria sp.]|nr:RNA polymerase sigma factor [Candidatus Eisenbacteria bacterium]